MPAKKEPNLFTGVESLKDDSHVNGESEPPVYQ